MSRFYGSLCTLYFESERYRIIDLLQLFLHCYIFKQINEYGPIYNE